MICTPHRGSHVIHACSERHSSTLSSPFHPTSSSPHASPISCSPSCTSSTTLRAAVTLRTPPKRRWSLMTSPTTQVMSPRTTISWRLASSPLQSPLTQPQFSEQRFLEDVDYDDTAHRVHVYHSQREDLSVGQLSSSVSERTERPVGERTGRPVGPIGQELNVANAQIRTLLDRQKESKFSPNVRRKLRNTNSRLKNLNDEINSFFMDSCCSQIWNYVKLIRKVSVTRKN